jgi:hypothetical protein
MGSKKGESRIKFEYMRKIWIEYDIYLYPADEAYIIVCVDEYLIGRV